MSTAMRLNGSRNACAISETNAISRASFAIVTRTQPFL